LMKALTRVARTPAPAFDRRFLRSRMCRGGSRSRR
jgi:hypothetical protein